jgi:hypothetical protein
MHGIFFSIGKMVQLRRTATFLALLIAASCVDFHSVAVGDLATVASTTPTTICNASASSPSSLFASTIRLISTRLVTVVYTKSRVTSSHEFISTIVNTTIGTSPIPDITPCTDTPVLPSAVMANSTVEEIPVPVMNARTTTQDSILSASNSKALGTPTLSRPQTSVQTSTQPYLDFSTAHVHSIISVSSSTAPNKTYAFYTSTTANATTSRTFSNGAKGICGSGSMLAVVLLFFGNLRL